jgi:hypothetical protein
MEVWRVVSFDLFAAHYQINAAHLQSGEIYVYLASVRFYDRFLE